MRAEPTCLETEALQLVALWRQGPAARHDPVLSNMFARLTSALDLKVPGLAGRIVEALEDMRSGSSSSPQSRDIEP